MHHNMTGTPDHIKAVAQRPLSFIPQKLDGAALADVLDRLDLPLPKEVRAMAAVSGEPFGKSGHRVSLAELDQKLAATSLKTEDRIKLKLALTESGLLPGRGR
jgi:hypothetical protein